MILEFRVKNYLSFKEEQVLSFEPTADKTYEDIFCVEVKPNVKILKLGIIYGANASGKTNILHALEFLRDIMTKHKETKSQNTGFIPFLFDEETKQLPGEFNLIFFINGTKYIYNIVLDDLIIYFEKLTYYPSTQPAIIFERRYNQNAKISEISFGSKSKLKAKDKNAIISNTITNTSALATYRKINVNSEEFDKILDWAINNFKPIIGPETSLFGYTVQKIEDAEISKEFVVDILRKADLNISDITIEDEAVNFTDKKFEEAFKSMLSNEVQDKLIRDGKFIRKSILFSHDIRTHNLIEEFRLDIDAESKGTKRYFELAGILHLLINTNSFVFIDELENSLHHDLLLHFIKTFLSNSTQSQLLFSTHDESILNHVINYKDSEFIRRDAIWFCEKDDSGATSVFSLSDFKLHKNISAYNAYRSGKLGAKPNLGNIYLENNGKKKK